MASRKKQGRKRRRRRRTKRPETLQPDEVFEAGPFRMARFGNMVRFQNTLNENDIARLHELLEGSEPDARDSVNRIVEELLSLLRVHDPLDLIAPISIQRSFGNVDDPESAKDREPVYDVEHLISLATAQPAPVSARAATSEVIQRAFDLLTELRSALSWYFIVRSASIGDTEEEELRSTTRLETLFVRGDEYEQIAREIFLGLFAPVSGFLKTHFGFDASDILSFYDAAEEQVEAAANAFFETFRAAVEYEAAELPPPDVVDVPENTPLAQDLPNSTKVVFEVSPRQRTDELICTALSHGFGENAGFLTDIPGWRGWPLNPSLLDTRPLVRYEDRVYLPCPPAMFRGLRRTVSELVKQGDARFFKNRFAAIRSEYLVSRTRQLFVRWFGEEHVFANAYYVPSDSSDRCEADLIVNRGTVALLVECKSGQLAPSARRGGLERLLMNLDELIADAHRQTIRTLTYIQQVPVATFTDASGKPLCSIDGGRLEHIFLLNITLEHLGKIACDAPRLSRLKLLNQRALPWVVSLADLIAIAEILDRPSVFLHYLLRRVRTEEQPAIRFVDELDALMVYLQQGLRFEGCTSHEQESLQIHNWTDDLDRYFLWKYLQTRPNKPQVTAVSRPQRRLPAESDQLISALEASESHAALSCALALLEMNDRNLCTLSRKIAELHALVRGDGRRHTLSIEFPVSGYDIVLSHDFVTLDEKEARQFARVRFRKGKARRVHVVSWTVASMKPMTIDRAMAWTFTR